LLSFEYVGEQLIVRTSSKLIGTPYAKYEGKVVKLPMELIHRPAQEIVSRRFEDFRQAEQPNGRQLPLRILG
jgi:hypothetical protein